VAGVSSTRRRRPPAIPRSRGGDRLNSSRRPRPAPSPGRDRGRRCRFRRAPLDRQIEVRPYHHRTRRRGRASAGFYGDRGPERSRSFPQRGGMIEIDGTKMHLVEFRDRADRWLRAGDRPGPFRSVTGMIARQMMREFPLHPPLLTRGIPLVGRRRARVAPEPCKIARSSCSNADDCNPPAEVIWEFPYTRPAGEPEIANHC
jgi:hypothetical protein